MQCFNHINEKFRFGKFKGCELGEVLMFSPTYINWILRNVDGSCCAFSDSVVEEIERIFPTYIINEKFEELRGFRLSQYQQALEFEEDDDENEFEDYPEHDTFERYGGSYAQDEMGYSDDDIDTIFDGDPSAYWNID